MQLIIEIDKEDYKIMKHNIAANNPLCPLSQEEMVSKVANGVPLPKGHGDLVSKKDIVDIIKKMPNDNPSYWNSCDVVDRQDLLDDIDDAPTIIEADKAESEGEEWKKNFQMR